MSCLALSCSVMKSSQELRQAVTTVSGILSFSSIDSFLSLLSLTMVPRMVSSYATTTRTGTVARDWTRNIGHHTDHTDHTDYKGVVPYKKYSKQYSTLNSCLYYTDINTYHIPNQIVGKKGNWYSTGRLLVVCHPMQQPQFPSPTDPLP